MLLIEDSNKEYEINNRKISEGAYADDMILHINRKVMVWGTFVRKVVYITGGINTM